MSVYSNNKLSDQTPNEAWHKIFKFVDSGKRILDVGCSSGMLGAELRRQKKAYVVGIDIDKKDVALAKKNLDDAKLVNIEKDDLSVLGEFDVIIMADVIEHLVDPVSAIKKLQKLLKKDGKFIFSIPNMANVTTRISLLGGSFEYKDFGLLDRTHIHFYDKQEVERVFIDAGMQIVETDCTLREIPDDILGENLKELGISLTPKLKEVLNSDEAITYQFIGWAKSSEKPKKFTPHTTSPLDSISQQIDSINKNYNHETELRDAELKRRGTHIEELDAKVEELNNELQRIYKSKLWKVSAKTKAIKRRISKK